MECLRAVASLQALYCLRGSVAGVTETRVWLAALLAQHSLRLASPPALEAGDHPKMAARLAQAQLRVPGEVNILSLCCPSFSILKTSISLSICLYLLLFLSYQC